LQVKFYLLLITPLPAAEEAAAEEEVAVLAEGAVVEVLAEVVLAEEVEAGLAEEAVVVVLAVSAIPVEVPVLFKAVNPAVVQVG
jgi:hypothetical protein